MINQPAGWSYWVHDCDYVNFDKVKILADAEFPNNDGIHINCCCGVTISDCNISCGDDCVVVRAYSSPHHENIVCEKVCVTNTSNSAVQVVFCEVEECDACEVKVEPRMATIAKGKSADFTVRLTRKSNVEIGCALKIRAARKSDRTDGKTIDLPVILAAREAFEIDIRELEIGERIGEGNFGI